VKRIGLTLLLGLALLLVLSPMALAEPGKDKDCTGCHLANSTVVTTLTDLTNSPVNSVTVAAGSTFRFRYRVDGLGYNKFSIAPALIFPDTAWKALPTTGGLDPNGNPTDTPWVPNIGGLSDVTANVWVADFKAPASPYYDGAQPDDGSVYDRDGIAHKAYFEAEVAVPAGLASGAYKVLVYGVGDIASGKATGVANLNVNVTAPADTAPPTAPTNLAAKAISSTQVDLSWTGSTDNVGVKGYSIYRSLDGLTFSYIGFSNVNTYSDQSAQASTTYYYYVTAFDAAGNYSVSSNVTSATTPAAGSDIAPPTTPVLSAQADANALGISLSWTASTDNVGVVKYDIYKKVGRSGNFVLLASVDAAALSYYDANISAGTSYFYYIIASDAAGNTAQSNTFKAVDRK
jgi:hypothetical protein